jgi:Leucine-rich repeat (LRR) protein
MDNPPSLPTPTILPGQQIGYVSNAGIGRYNLEAESTTGFVAWRLADGTTLISAAAQVSLHESLYVTFWPCLGYSDTTPTGRITYFDCHGCGLVALDVTHLEGLEYLDCSYNRLAELPLDGLTELQAIDADNNCLTRLEVRHLLQLRSLSCANNRLTALDVSGLGALQILDYSGNPLPDSLRIAQSER